MDLEMITLTEGSQRDKKPMISLMGRISKSIQRATFTKHKDAHTLITRTNFWLPKGKGVLGEGRHTLGGWGLHTHSNILHVFYKQMTDKDLLYKRTQHSVITRQEKNLKKHTYMYHVTESVCFIPKTPLGKSTLLQHTKNT